MVGRVSSWVFHKKYWQSIIWNNKDVCINNAPVFDKTFFEPGIICVNDLLFDLNNKTRII